MIHNAETLIYLLAVHRSRGEQRVDGLLLRGPTGYVKTSPGFRTNEEKPGITKH